MSRPPASPPPTLPAPWNPRPAASGSESKLSPPRSALQVSPSPAAPVALPVARGTCAPRPRATVSAPAWTGPELAAVACGPNSLRLRLGGGGAGLGAWPGLGGAGSCLRGAGLEINLREDDGESPGCVLLSSVGCGCLSRHLQKEQGARGRGVGDSRDFLPPHSPLLPCPPVPLLKMGP